ncbi:hypothetical protein WR25_16877 [Diploscapter pachys]|uniref:F-box domain-containing protein n=1 Tax=Diploscapter pachys TaxID=2018661 RepID=A0A2A2LDL4_9BILA|nr:hypothetical protein WR25_16877 [Diploscapter pachys]
MGQSASPSHTGLVARPEDRLLLCATAEGFIRFLEMGKKARPSPSNFGSKSEIDCLMRTWKEFCYWNDLPYDIKHVAVLASGSDSNEPSSSLDLYSRSFSRISYEDCGTYNCEMCISKWTGTERKDYRKKHNESLLTEEVRFRAWTYFCKLLECGHTAKVLEIDIEALDSDYRNMLENSLKSAINSKKEICEMLSLKIADYDDILWVFKLMAPLIQSLSIKIYDKHLKFDSATLFEEFCGSEELTNMKTLNVKCPVTMTDNQFLALNAVSIRLRSDSITTLGYNDYIKRWCSSDSQIKSFFSVHTLATSLLTNKCLKSILKEVKYKMIKIEELSDDEFIDLEELIRELRKCFLNNRVFMIYPEDDNSHRRGLLFTSMGTLETGIPKIAQKRKKVKMASQEEIASLKKHHKSFGQWNRLILLQYCDLADRMTVRWVNRQCWNICETPKIVFNNLTLTNMCRDLLRTDPFYSRYEQNFGGWQEILVKTQIPSEHVLLRELYTRIFVEKDKQIRVYRAIENEFKMRSYPSYKTSTHNESWMYFCRLLSKAKFIDLLEIHLDYIKDSSKYMLDQALENSPFEQFPCNHLKLNILDYSDLKWLIGKMGPITEKLTIQCKNSPERSALFNDLFDLESVINCENLDIGNLCLISGEQFMSLKFITCKLKTETIRSWEYNDYIKRWCSAESPHRTYLQIDTGRFNYMECDEVILEDVNYKKFFALSAFDYKLV